MNIVMAAIDLGQNAGRHTMKPLFYSGRCGGHDAGIGVRTLGSSCCGDLT